MEFKFDIRILAISLLIHFSAFALMSIYTAKKTPVRDTIEVVIHDARDEKIFLPSQKLKEKPEETKNSKFFSEAPQTFKKETVAEELGSFKNQNKRAAQKSSEENLKLDSKVGANFMPLANQKSELEERQSTINFQVPNLAKGEMTFLNSDFSTYASFYNRITPKIVYTWGNNIDDIALFPHMREKLRTKIRWTTRVELILNRLGHFKSLIIINSSGSDELDQAVVDALKTAGPYLNPPSGMIEKDGTVHITGEFAVYTQRPHYANPY